MLSQKSLKAKLDQSIIYVKYKSLITSEQKQYEIPSYLNSKCKIKIRQTKLSLPKLFTIIPSLPSQKSLSNKHQCSHSRIPQIESSQKVHERLPSIVNDTYFLRTSQGGYFETLLTQNKQKKQ
ncbi:unnamed protein product [Paramecium primaurelia]|uniref:Uncharacterized protein n=2 Tax=Paramecium TaxID=5884 RepID=A0A8S1WQC1_9CILI|nr:unnamed protein product [Paramecium primaurelia]CAD8191893.1 unnamed protein product [Paramecium pentaurelia]